MTGNKEGLWIRKGAATFEFDYRFRSGSGVLMGIKIGVRNASAGTNESARKNIQAQLVHAMLGHPSNEHSKVTCSRLGINLTGRFPICDGCAHAKIKQKNKNKYSKDPATVKGERICFDISSVKKDSSGGAKLWLMAIDEATRYQWSCFLKSKSETKSKMIELTKNEHNVVIKNFRCDNAEKTLILRRILRNIDSIQTLNIQRKEHHSIMGS